MVLGIFSHPMTFGVSLISFAQWLDWWGLMNFDSSGIYSIGLYNVGTNTKSWL
jgi:hypothetical protein